MLGARKLEAIKRLKNAAESCTSNERFVELLAVCLLILHFMFPA